MSRADEATRNELRSLLADSKMPAERKIAAVKAIYDRLDVPHLTEQQIELRFERALAQLEQEGLARADRTAGRLVTQDFAVLEAARLREAEAVIRDYFEAMSSLGYSRERAVELLKEEFS